MMKLSPYEHLGRSLSAMVLPEAVESMLARIAQTYGVSPTTVRNRYMSWKYRSAKLQNAQIYTYLHMECYRDSQQAWQKAE